MTITLTLPQYNKNFIEIEKEETIENKISVTETYQSTSKATGYILYSNGFCIQWGQLTLTGTNTWTTITLLVPYNNAYYSIFAVNSGVSTGPITVKVSSGSLQTTSTFQLQGANDTTGINWLTIGFTS